MLRVGGSVADNIKMTTHEVPVTQMIHDWALEAAKISLANEDQSGLSPEQIAEKLREAYYEARKPLVARLKGETKKS